MASEAGRELNYLHWPHEDLAKAMVQAEDEIRELRLDLEALGDERDQYLEESRYSAVQLGGIARILRGDGGTVVTGRERRRKEVPEYPEHRYSHTGLDAVCSCGRQWLTQAERCVTQPAGL